MFRPSIKFASALSLIISTLFAYTPTEDALLSTGSYSITGTFGAHDFAGAESAFDWAFTTSNGTSYQLQGNPPKANDVFGWKLVSITTPSPTWYMISLGSDVDGDDSQKFDWVLLSTNMSKKAVYKLAGVADNKTFKYSSKLDVDYSVSGTTVTINNSGYTPAAMSAQECETLAQQMLDYENKLDVPLPASANITKAISASNSSASCKTVEALVYYTDYNFGYTHDYSKAKLLFEDAASDGNPIAQARLGRIYFNGWGVAEDYAKAKQWFEKAAAQNYADGQFMMGFFYHYGYGVTQNYTTAKSWYDKAAAQHYPWAQIGLGDLYYYGDGVTQNYATAKSWYEKSAAKENDYGQVKMGDIYYFGHGVPQNYDTARIWYEKSAAQDNAYALYSLGWLYYYGEGVAVNKTTAKNYLERAADLGYENAQKFLDEKNLRASTKMQQISKPSRFVSSVR